MNIWSNPSITKPDRYLDSTLRTADVNNKIRMFILREGSLTMSYLDNFDNESPNKYKLNLKINKKSCRYVLLLID
jgi:hypothetical protein